MPWKCDHCGANNPDQSDETEVLFGGPGQSKTCQECGAKNKQRPPSELMKQCQKLAEEQNLVILTPIDQSNDPRLADTTGKDGICNAVAAALMRLVNTEGPGEAVQMFGKMLDFHLDDLIEQQIALDGLGKRLQRFANYLAEKEKSLQPLIDAYRTGDRNDDLVLQLSGSLEQFKSIKGNALCLVNELNLLQSEGLSEGTAIQRGAFGSMIDELRQTLNGRRGAFRLAFLPAEATKVTKFFQSLATILGFGAFVPAPTGHAIALVGWPGCWWLGDANTCLWQAPNLDALLTLLQEVIAMTFGDEFEDGSYTLRHYARPSI